MVKINEVLEIIEGRDEINTPQLYEECKVTTQRDKEKVRNCVHKLFKQGKINKESRGLYSKKEK